MALSEDALRRSVVALIKTNAPLAGDDLRVFEQFYDQLRRGVERGELRKCYKITVAQVLRGEADGP